MGAQGQVKLVKTPKTCPHCHVPNRKPQTQIQTFFLIATRSLAESVDSLNTSLALSTGEIWVKESETIYRLLRFVGSNCRVYYEKLHNRTGSRACSKNNISMINVFTLTNINTRIIKGKLSKIFISEVCVKLVALRFNRYTRRSSQFQKSWWPLD